MILYDASIPATLTEFGIQIPIRNSRTTATFDALMNHPQLGRTVAQWHRRQATERLDREDLLRVHSPEYVETLYSSRLESAITSTYELIAADGGYHRYAPDKATRPLAELFDRTLHKAAGSAQCARLALEHGFCFYFSGGMHHAHADHGGGFCLINDLVIAARKMQAEGRADRIWIIDVDAHKGDGTAAITAGDDSITTLSVHMADGWPLDGPPVLEDGSPNPSFVPSDIDIPVAAGEEPYYLERLEQGLEKLERFPRADLAIVECGADPWEEDELPSTAPLKLSLPQLMERDQVIYGFLKERGIPNASLMAGGYGDKVWQVFAQYLIWVLAREGYAGIP